MGNERHTTTMMAGLLAVDQPPKCDAADEMAKLTSATFCIGKAPYPDGNRLYAIQM